MTLEFHPKARSSGAAGSIYSRLLFLSSIQAIGIRISHPLASTDFLGPPLHTNTRSCKSSLQTPGTITLEASEQYAKLIDLLLPLSWWHLSICNLPQIYLRTKITPHIIFQFPSSYLRQLFHHTIATPGLRRISIHFFPPYPDFWPQGDDLLGVLRANCR